MVYVRDTVWKNRLFEIVQPVLLGVLVPLTFSKMPFVAVVALKKSKMLLFLIVLPVLRSAVLAVPVDVMPFNRDVPEFVELTLQVSIGFLLTMVSMQLVPPVVALVGWRWAFAVLSLGPAAGIWAIRQLRPGSS